MQTSGVNTGEQQREEVNTESCSVGYNTTRWVSVGTNLTACPACTSSNCSGVDKRCVNGICETGVLVVTNQTFFHGTYTCTYHYEWSDGYWSGNYTMTQSTPCPIN